MNRKKMLALLLGLVMVFGTFTTVLADVVWYDDAVKFTIAEGLFEDATPFGWDTKAEAGKAIWTIYKIAGEPEVEAKEIEGVDESILSAVNWAVAEKAVEAKDFDASAEITRAEIAVLFDAAAKAKGFEATGNRDLIKKLSDFDTVDAKYVDSVVAAFNLGIMKGNANNTLNLNAPVLNVELAQMLKNFAELGSVSGKTTAISKYGNIATEISIEDFNAAGFTLGDIVKVTVGEKSALVPYGDAYSNVDNKKEVILADKEPVNVAVAINMGNFAEEYGVKVGTEISFAIAEKGGYLEEYEIRNIDALRTYDRADYESDEVYANFRPIVMGDIKEGMLYRSSSPINPELSRQKYANDLIEKAGVKTVINMADSVEELEAYLVAEDFASDYYKSLYEEGSAILLSMGVDFEAKEFNEKFKKGLEFMLFKEGPYLFHCNEGKDRAGFASIFLEALMGGTFEEIREDYMVSYINYYHVEKDSEQYDKIAKSNVEKSLRMIAGIDDEADISKVDLKAAAEVYAVEVIGLTKEEVIGIQNILSGNAAAELDIAA